MDLANYRHGIERINPMGSKEITTKAFIEEQMKHWLGFLPPERTHEKVSIPVVTICMEPGSGGHLVAKGIADRLQYDLYDKSILVSMANIADVDSKSFELLEKARPSGAQDIVMSLMDKKHIDSSLYVEQLKSTVSVIGKIGHAVIVGRGANFILPPEKRFSIRVVAPFDVRVRNVSFKYGVSLEEAKKRINNRAAKRKAFVREIFHQDIGDIMHYDLVINTGRIDLETAVGTAIGGVIGAQANKSFEKATSYILRKSK